MGARRSGGPSRELMKMWMGEEGGDVVMWVRIEPMISRGWLPSLVGREEEGESNATPATVVRICRIVRLGM